MKINKLYLIILLLILSGGAYSQIIFDTLQLREFEIVASFADIQSPTNVTTIDSLHKNDLKLSNIGELLAAFTPVFVKSYGRGSLATVSFRGTGASHTKVVWEGFDINSPMLGQTDFSTIPVSMFNGIELHYGGSSLTEVGGALGGSIVLKTDQDFNFNKTISLAQSIGSYNTYLTNISIILSNDKISSTTNFTRQSSKNDFTYYNNAILPEGREMKQTNAEFTNYGFSQQLSAKLGDNQTITATSWNQWNDRNIPHIMTNIEKSGSQDEYQMDQFSRNILKWLLTSNRTTLEFKGAYFYEKLDYMLQTNDSLGNIISQIDSKNKVHSSSGAANLSIHFTDELILKIGSKYLNQRVVSNNYDEDKTRNIISNYANFSTKIGRKLKAELLLRSEIVDGSFTPIMPMLGINFKPLTNKDLFIRFNISRNYNLPSLNDLYWYPGGNDTLLPEQSYEGEVGIDYSFNIHNILMATIRTTGYYSVVDNWILWTPGDNRYWSPQNIANVLSRGAEISLKISNTSTKLQYSLFAEYAYTRTTDNSEDAKETGSSDVQLMYVPKNTFNSYISLSLGSYYLNWGLNFIDSRNTSLNNSENYSYTLPGYTLNNISIGKSGQIKKVAYELRFKVYNIFNVDYQAVLWRAMPRRNYELSISLTL